MDSFGLPIGQIAFLGIEIDSDDMDLTFFQQGGPTILLETVGRANVTKSGHDIVLGLWCSCATFFTDC